MSKSRLMKVSYRDLKAEVFLENYADTLIYDPGGLRLIGIRFGGYPEQVRAMSDAIYGGGSVTIGIHGKDYTFGSQAKRYRRQMSNDGIYAEATLTALDDELSAEPDSENGEKDEKSTVPRTTFIFCEQDDTEQLFEEIDRKAAVPLIPEFREYVLSELKKRKILKPLTVVSVHEQFEAWMLDCSHGDKEIIDVLEDGLKSGSISIEGGVPAAVFEEINTVSQYLNAFGVTVAERIKGLF